MISRESTFGCSSWMPSMALEMASSPSFLNGMVTTATVRMPRSLAILAMTGEAPVPVPPPMPAVMKTILVSGVRSFSAMMSWDSMAAFRPSVGFVPAPRPSPSWILIGTLLFSRACRSVLQTMKLQPWTFWLYMYVTALQPPPPTPMTLIGETSGIQSVGVTMLSISI